MELTEIENKIKAITGTNIEGGDRWLNVADKRMIVKNLLRERRNLLNRMFDADETAKLRFREINERLFTLTHQLYERINKLHDDLSGIKTQKDFDDDYNLEGTLRFYNCFEF